ncbi:MAG: glycosyltransferase, partial [Planctomycetota bacterium]
MERVSAIVTTYNRSGHLRNCIASLERQSRLPDEVVIADDGSDPEHVAAIERIMGASPLSVIYARQEHAGFRAAANRNNGVRHSSGDHLFFVDGDAAFPEWHSSPTGRPCQAWMGARGGRAKGRSRIRGF